MPRGRKANTKCQRHDFMLKPLKTQCYFSQTITNSFCDPNSQKKNNSNNQKQAKLCLSCPSYNNDRNFATPTFILQSEKNYYQSNYSKLKMQHEKKIDDFTDEKQELLVPKPRSKNNYCSVCRQNYHDYLEHIKSDDHLRQIKVSKYNAHILNLVEKFRTQNKIAKIKQEILSKPIVNSSTNSLQQASSVEQIDQHKFLEMGRPTKKVKRDQTIDLIMENNQNANLNIIPQRLPQKNVSNFTNQQLFESAQRINSFTQRFTMPSYYSNQYQNQYQNQYLFRENVERMNCGQFTQPMNQFLNPISINSFQANRSDPYMRYPENQIPLNLSNDQFRNMNLGLPDFKYNSSHFQSTALYSPPPHFYTSQQFCANIALANQFQMPPRSELVVIDSE